MNETNTEYSRLPLPDAQAQAHSAALVAQIAARIEKQGVISFTDFMQAALYTPGLGYYMAGATRFGRDGDFITAPGLSPLFGRCVARQCQQWLAALRGGDVLELGPGSGELAVSVLLALHAQKQCPAHYYLLELSAPLRAQQQQLLSERLPAELLARCVWLETLPSHFCGVVLANEVLDAMPVTLFECTAQGVRERGVTRAAQQFAWQHLPQENTLLTELIAPLQLPLGYQSEINLWLPAWFNSLAQCVEQGAMLLIDYGYSQAHYYHPERDSGSLQCHYRHRAHSDPFFYPGLQDITAHVNFEWAALCAQRAGFTNIFFTSQAKFLINNGILQLADTTDPVLAAQVRQLIMPSGMGDKFHVLALSRGIEFN